MDASTIIIDGVPQEGPDTSMRLGAEKDDFKAAAERDGFKNLATWMKWLARLRIQEQNRAAPSLTVENPATKDLEE
jgi:hypothetical protein